MVSPSSACLRRIGSGLRRRSYSHPPACAVIGVSAVVTAARMTVNQTRCPRRAAGHSAQAISSSAVSGARTTRKCTNSTWAGRPCYDSSSARRDHNAFDGGQGSAQRRSSGSLMRLGLLAQPYEFALGYSTWVTTSNKKAVAAQANERHNPHRRAARQPQHWPAELFARGGAGRQRRHRLGGRHRGRRGRGHRRCAVRSSPPGWRAW